MNTGTEHDMQKLFAAARTDSPTAASRDAIWDGVASSVASVAGVAGGATAAAAAAGSTSKLLTWGALFGGGVTVGAAAIAFHVHTASMHATVVQSTAPGSALSGESCGRVNDLPPPLARPYLTESVVVKRAAPEPHAARSVRPSGSNSDADRLVREAQFVGDARAALARGDANRALVLVAACKRLGERRMEPEEMTLEARALRLVGREREAVVIEAALREQFPEHALAR